jgi:hypothetical protein
MRWIPSRHTFFLPVKVLTIGPRIGLTSVSSSLIQPLLQAEHTPLSLKSPE